MSTKFFDTKKSGTVKKTKEMKRGLIAVTVVAVTLAAGMGGYKLMNRENNTRVADAPVSSHNNVTTNDRSEPSPRSSKGFLSFGEQQKPVVSNVTKAAKKHGKQVAKHGKKHHGKKIAKHGKKHHGKKIAMHKKKHGKHLAKHTKKHGKKVAKHSKKKVQHKDLTTASR